jgi:predicted transcriptional regulator
MLHRILITRLDRAPVPDRHHDLAWLCTSIGLSSGRDTEYIALQVVQALIERIAGEENGVPVELIAADLGIAPARVNHHLRHLVDAGIVFRRNRRIFLRGGSLYATVRELRRDVNRVFDDIEESARELDDLYGIPNR